jgi:hypothetical protein
MRQVAQGLLGVDVVDDRADRHDDFGVQAAPSAAIRAAARLAVARLERAQVAEVREGVETLLRDEEHIAAVTTVAAIRSAERDGLLATETHDAPPAVTGLGLDRGFVDELHGEGTSG